MIENTGERETSVEYGTLKGVENSHIIRYVFAYPYVENKKVLDVACGIGYGTKILSEKANFVVGWDYSKEAIMLAKQYYQTHNCSFAIVDAEKELPKDNKFDTIVSFETIEHLSNGEHFLNKLIKILVKDGTLVISTPYVDYRGFSGWKFHKREYTRRQFCNLLKKHFSHIQLFIQPGTGRYIIPFWKRFFEDLSTASCTLIAVCTNNKSLFSERVNLLNIGRVYFNGLVKRKIKDFLTIFRMLKKV